MASFKVEGHFLHTAPLGSLPPLPTTVGAHLVNMMAISVQYEIAILSEVRGDGRFFHVVRNHSSRSHTAEIIFLLSEKCTSAFCETNCTFMLHTLKVSRCRFAAMNTQTLLSSLFSNQHTPKGWAPL